MSRIRDLAPEKRPREKAGRLGLAALSDAEILALIFGSGTAGISALDLGEALLNKHRDLTALSKQSLSSLKNSLGLKAPTAWRLLAAFELARRLEKETKPALVYGKPEDIFERYKTEFSLAPQEMLLVVMMNRQNRILREEIVYKGSIASLVVAPREIFVRLLACDASHFVLVHNHPGGLAEPSGEDIAMTLAIAEQARKLGLRLVDHLIIAGGTFYAFSAHGL